MTAIFGTCIIFSPCVPIFITLGQGVHEKRQSYMDHSKNEILGEIPLNMTSIDGFPLSDDTFSIFCNSTFGISPDEFNAKPDVFL